MEIYIITRQTFIKGHQLREDNPVIVTFLSHQNALEWLTNLAKRENAMNRMCYIPTSCDILESLAIPFKNVQTVYTIIKDCVI